MKRKNGFTLAEMVGVIVIISVIALIAVPSVIYLINDSNKKAFENSAHGIINAADAYYYSNDMMGELLEDSLFEFPNNIEGLKINGEVPQRGKMLVAKEGYTALAISNGKYCIKKDYLSEELTIDDNLVDCKLPRKPIFNPNPNISSENDCIRYDEECNNGTLVNVKVNETEDYDFYIIDDTGKELTLIMDRNLGGPIEWITKTDYDIENNKDETPTICEYQSCNDEGPITAINALDERTKEWTNVKNQEYTYSGLTEDGITRKYDDITRKMRARMLTFEEAISEKIGCTFHQSVGASNCPTYLYTNLSNQNIPEIHWGYWSSSSSISWKPHGAYMVTSAGELEPDSYHVIYRNESIGDHFGYIGIRPVIMISKEKDE